MFFDEQRTAVICDRSRVRRRSLEFLVQGTFGGCLGLGRAEASIQFATPSGSVESRISFAQAAEFPLQPDVIDPAKMLAAIARGTRTHATPHYTRQRQMGIGDLLLENRIIFLDGPIHDGSATGRDEAVVPAVRKPPSGHSPVRELPRWFGHGHHGHLRHHAVPRLRHLHLLRGTGRQRRRDRAGGRNEGETLRPQALEDDDHQPYGQVGGQVSDIEIQAKDILDTREILNQILAKHTGQPIEVIARDTERDRYLSAALAKNTASSTTFSSVRRPRTKARGT